MFKFIFLFAVLLLVFTGCKTSDSPQTEPNVETVNTSTEYSSNRDATSSSVLSKEEQHKFDALINQGDSNFAEGQYRDALNFYKQAQALAPQQLGNEKLIACLKALQEPSTRKKTTSK